jgi:hypothetical protein
MWTKESETWAKAYCGAKAHQDEVGQSETWPTGRIGPNGQVRPGAAERLGSGGQGAYRSHVFGIEVTWVPRVCDGVPTS